MTYPIRYTIEPGNWERADVESTYQGLSDSIMICSVMEEDGATSHAFFGVHGKTGVLMNDNDLFKAWTMLALDEAVPIFNKAKGEMG